MCWARLSQQPQILKVTRLHPQCLLSVFAEHKRQELNGEAIWMVSTKCARHSSGLLNVALTL